MEDLIITATIVLILVVVCYLYLMVRTLCKLKEIHYKDEDTDNKREGQENVQGK
jgi:hypothetical protein